MHERWGEEDPQVTWITWATWATYQDAKAPGKIGSCSKCPPHRDGHGAALPRLLPQVQVEGLQHQPGLVCQPGVAVLPGVGDVLAQQLLRQGGLLVIARMHEQALGQLDSARQRERRGAEGSGYPWHQLSHYERY